MEHLEDEHLHGYWETSTLFGRHHFLESFPKSHIERELSDFYVH